MGYDAPQGKEVLALDSVQIKAFLACQRKWHLGFAEHLVPLVEPEAFGKGRFVHLLLEYYYKNRRTQGVTEAANAAMAQAHDHVQKNAKEFSLTPEDTKFLDQRFLSYAYSTAGEKIEVIDTEIGFSVPILETPTHLFALEGRLDLLLKLNDRLTWMDHKTQSRSYDHYEFDVQFLNYCVALGTKFGCVNYVGLQKSGDPASWFRRLPISFNQQQLNEWRFELIHIFYDVLRAKNLGRTRKNRLSCKNGLNFKCEFTHICEQTSPEFAAEIKRTEFQVREPWTPWKEGENA